MSVNVNLEIDSATARVGGPFQPSMRLIWFRLRKIFSLGSSGQASSFSMSLSAGTKYELPVFVQGTRNFLSNQADIQALTPSGFFVDAKPAQWLMLKQPNRPAGPCGQMAKSIKPAIRFWFASLESRPAR